MITLYGPRMLPLVEKVARALMLKRLDFALHEPKSLAEHQSLSRSGRLPVIDLEGERIEDSMLILLRLDQVHPEPPLLSTDPRTAKAQQELARWIDESFIWYWIRWQRLRPQAPPRESPVAAALYAESGTEQPPETPRPAGVSLRSWLARRHREPGPPRGEVARLAEGVGNRTDDLARLLTDRPFFYADRASMADLAAYAVLRSLLDGSVPGGRDHVERHPNLVEHVNRVESVTEG